MPKAIHRHSDPRRDVSLHQTLVRTDAQRKSPDTVRFNPSPVAQDSSNRLSTSQNGHASRRKSTDSSTHKRVRPTDDPPKTPLDVEPQKASSSKKTHLSPANKQLNGHATSSEGGSNLTKKPKLDHHTESEELGSQSSELTPTSDSSRKEIGNGDAPLERCHQCRAEFPLEHILTCYNTKDAQKAKRIKSNSAGVEGSTSVQSKKANGSTSPIKCLTKYCSKCLRSRYGEALEKIRSTARSPYTWACPMCMDYCNCSTCRKKKGLLPTGRLEKVMSEAGYGSARELLEAVPNAQGSQMISLANKKKQKEENNEHAVDPAVKSTKEKTHDVKSSKSKEIKVKNLQTKQGVATIVPPSIEIPKKSNSKKEAKTDLPYKKLKAADPPNQKVKNDPQHQLVKNNHQSNKVKSESLPKKPKTDPQTKKPKPTHIESGPTEANAKRHVSGSSEPTQLSLSDAEPSDVQVQPVAPKVSVKRGPRPVPAPSSLSSIPTGNLTSEQIRLRLHVREFVFRFRSLLPGLGRTEHANSKSETQRVEKILDSMDDVVNFWIDDEGGMRAIMSGLVRLILSEIDAKEPESNTVLLSSNSHATLSQLNKESKLSTVAPRNTCNSWLTAQLFLTEEGLGDQLSESMKNVYIQEPVGSDQRLARVKVLPEQKLAVIIGLIDVALRGKILAEDLLQGLERERQAKADIVRDRVKLNKQWQEDKTRLLAAMPSKESLLETDPPKKGKQLQMAQEEEAERLQRLAEWEAQMAQADADHKNGLRLSGIAQYLAGSLNRLRFLPIGQDTRGNTYYILSSTPGRIYPQEPSELAYAWSYNLLIHGSEPNDQVPPLQTSAQASSKSGAQVKDQLKQVLPDDEDIDMLEGGQRALDDQWIRVSDPIEIRKLGCWIDYEARLIDYRQSESSTETDALTSAHADGTGNKVSKSVAGLVEQINTFAEYLELKITEAEEHLGKRVTKSRVAVRTTS